MARAKSDNKKHTASATGLASVLDQASGDVVSHASVSREKFGIPRAARVLKGPAATKFDRIPTAALRYQHSSLERDRVIAERLSGLSGHNGHTNP